MKRESFRKGMKDGVPIALGYFAVSFTFGMMAVAGGLSIWQAVLISLTNLTSPVSLRDWTLFLREAPCGRWQ